MANLKHPKETSCSFRPPDACNVLCIQLAPASQTPVPSANAQARHLHVNAEVKELSIVSHTSYENVQNSEDDAVLV